MSDPSQQLQVDLTLTRVALADAKRTLANARIQLALAKTRLEAVERQLQEGKV